jgi:hypothetical protein
VPIDHPILYHAALLSIAGTCIYSAIQGFRTGEILFFYTKLRRSDSPARFWFVVFLVGVGGLVIAFWVLTGMFG